MGDRVDSVGLAKFWQATASEPSSTENRLNAPYLHPQCYLQPPSHRATNNTGVLPEEEFGYLKALLTMLKDGKPLVLPKWQPQRLGQWTAVNSMICCKPTTPAFYIYYPVSCLAPASSVEDATQPAPASSVEDGAHPDPTPFPGTRDVACPDPAPVPGVRDDAHPNPVPAPVPSIMSVPVAVLLDPPLTGAATPPNLPDLLQNAAAAPADLPPIAVPPDPPKNTTAAPPDPLGPASGAKDTSQLVPLPGMEVTRPVPAPCSRPVPVVVPHDSPVLKKAATDNDIADGMVFPLPEARKLSDMVSLKGTFMCDVPVGDDAPVFVVLEEKVVPIVPYSEMPDLMSQKELAVAQRADSTLLHCFTLTDKKKYKKLQDILASLCWPEEALAWCQPLQKDRASKKEKGRGKGDKKRDRMTSASALDWDELLSLAMAALGKQQQEHSELQSMDDCFANSVDSLYVSPCTQAGEC
ncbi:hypothetical protein P4O66_003362 [Electrophorus voltai]|uniref:Uncharacterized protein n=1 Tax=Electrophorus voltai TaxID=2609070 RepID=A0AAD9DJE7_9TELE|nr:hypothetical protein P4O66_003362 [Electrophorus voltai]